MTADYYPFEHSCLSPTATRIFNEVRGIDCVRMTVVGTQRRRRGLISRVP